MKNIKEYINESIEYQIDEGLKEWFKKFALTGAIALASINSINAQAINVNQNYLDDAKDKIENVMQQEYDDVKTVEGVSKDEQLALNTAKGHADKEIEASNGKLKIINTKKFYSKSTKTYKYVITLGTK